MATPLSTVPDRDHELVEEQQDSALLRLPGEVLNKIYRYVLVSKGSIALHRRKRSYLIRAAQVEAIPGWKTTGYVALLPGHPALMLVCRTTYEEVRSIYYLENTFEFTTSTLTPSTIQAFRRLAGHHSDKIASLTISRNFLMTQYIKKIGVAHMCFTASLSGSNLEIQMKNHITRTERVISPELKDTHDRLCLRELHLLAEANLNLLDFVEAYAGRHILGENPIVSLDCEECQKRQVL